MGYRYIVIVALLFTMLTGRISAACNVEEADSAYNRGDYDNAVECYVAVMESQGTSASLLFNLGNAYFKANNWGQAMLCYEQARRLDPSDAKINNNLDYLASRVEDANKAELKGKKYSVAPDEASFFESVHDIIAKNISSDVWAVFAAIAFVLFVAFLALYIFSSMVAARKVGFFSAIIFLGFSAVFLAFSFWADKAFRSRGEGVITAYKTELLTEPLDNSKPVATPLTRGTRMRIISEEVDSEGMVDWFKVRLNSDFTGWIKASDFSVIEIR